MLTLYSPAKVNLFLKVMGRRSDGYHELASLFQTVSLYDQLQLTLAQEDALTCNLSSLPTDGRNLVIKAAALFRSKTGFTHGLRVHLEKQIPQEAGLGGGSSNAATTLWGFNQLCGCPATEQQLAEWAAEIGSDVAFFFSTGTAYCTGRGEVVKSVSMSTPMPLWIVKPHYGLSTPAVYHQLQLERLCTRDPLQALQNCVKGNLESFNDLEEPAFDLCPALKKLKEELRGCGFSAVLMTGSGSGFYCVGEGTPPMREGLFCKRVRSVQRNSQGWYDRLFAEVIFH